ncbi:unnamed protein product, partial [Durusdinium trenchii]
AEERARLKKEEADGDSPEPPSKRVCNTYEKQITKMPDGDLQTVKDLLDYVGSFKGESSTEGHHPAALVAEVFGSSSAEHNLLHCQQLESWYQEYATNVRKAPYLYKKAVIDPSMNGETIKVPITCLRFCPPEDGLPVCDDWITTFESMLFGGVDLNRVSFNMGAADRSFRNMSLSFRGSERQAPSTLQLALRFSRILELYEQEGRHHAEMSVEQRLTDAVQQFHDSAGLQSKHRIEEERFRAVLNLLSGTCEESRAMIRAHLDSHKSHQSAFSTEQFKGTRWLLTASPKASNCPSDLRKCLTVTPLSQTLHLKLVVKTFMDSARRLRASSRARARLSQSQFEQLCDFSCVYAHIWSEAKLLSTWDEDKDAAMEKAFFQKDYAMDIEAAVTAKLSTWKPQHLSLWADLVEPPASVAHVATAQELMEIEDQAQAARFREVRAKLSQDIAAMTAFNTAKDETQRRSHVVSVMHEKAQVSTGKQLCESYMEKWCRVSLVNKKDSFDTGLDSAIRLAASSHKVDMKDVDTILFFDCTKLGVLNQAEINLIGDCSERVLFRNPSRSVLVLIPPLLCGTEGGGSLRADMRKIEDKLLMCRVELKAFTLNLDLSDIHGNRELPSAFVCYLGVPDCTLPSKGTAHRVVRGAPGPDDTTNVFCSSHLWSRQSLPLRCFPKALDEKHFVVPGEAFLCHDSRRSLTDLQETAQWLGGVPVCASILESLTGRACWLWQVGILACYHSFNGICDISACL